jgi:hypothetical protein
VTQIAIVVNDQNRAPSHLRRNAIQFSFRRSSTVEGIL